MVYKFLRRNGCINFWINRNVLFENPDGKAVSKLFHDSVTNSFSIKCKNIPPKFEDAKVIFLENMNEIS